MATRVLDIDRDHSTIEFAVTFAMNTVIKGRFREFSGRIMLDEANPAGSSVTVSIEASSIETGAERRDEQLRSRDFFDVETWEALTFESSSVEIAGDNHWNVLGELSMLGSARPVTLDTHYYGIVEDAFGTVRTGFVCETDINRSDWGMNWNEEQETGVLISDRVRIALYVSAIPAEGESDDGEPASTE